MHEVTVKILLFTYSRETSKGYPIKARFIYRRKTKYVHLNMYSSPEDWNDRVGLVKSSHPESSKINKRIKEVELKAYEAIEKGFNLDGVAEYVSGERPSLTSFSEVSRHHIKGLRTAGRETTATVYNTALLQLERVLRKKDLSIEDVSYANLKSFRNVKESEGAANSTVHNYLRSIRTLVNEAINQGYMSQSDYPFKKGLFPKVEVTRKQALSRDQIRELEALDLSSDKLKDQARNIFLLQYYLAGIDYIDLAQVTSKQMESSSLLFFRKKLSGGGFEVEVPILQKARELVSKLKVKRDQLNIIPSVNDPVAEPKKFAWQRSRIQRRMNSLLPGVHIGTKTARHTFATHGRQARVDPDTLAQLMGHEVPGYQIANIYKERFSEEELKIVLESIYTQSL